MTLAMVGGHHTAALQTIFSGGGYVPPGNWIARGPLYYGPDVNVQIAGTLIYDQPQPGWNSAYLICSRGYPNQRVGNVTLDFSQGGKIILPNSGVAAPRKGIGMTYTDGFRLLYPRVEGGDGNNLFACQFHDSNNGYLYRGRLAVRPASARQGADGLHLTGENHDHLIVGLVTASGDDASSATLEIPAQANRTIQRITFRSCVLNNWGHHAAKIKILPGTGAAVIRDVWWENCDCVTVPTILGAGGLIEFDNLSSTAIVERVGFRKGRLRIAPPPTAQVNGPAILLNKIAGFRIDDTVIEHYSRRLIQAVDCPDLYFHPKSVAAIRVVPIPSTPTSLVALTRCARSDIDMAVLKAAYPGQTLMTVS